MLQGRNSRGTIGYFGPRPPVGVTTITSRCSPSTGRWGSSRARAARRCWRRWRVTCSRAGSSWRPTRRLLHRRNCRTGAAALGRGV